MDEEPEACVIDNGTSTIKAGFAGDDDPRIVCPSVVGRPRNQIDSIVSFVSHWSDYQITIDPVIKLIRDYAKLQHYYIGKEALAMRGVPKITRPVECGKIYNWEDMVYSIDSLSFSVPVFDS